MNRLWVSRALLVLLLLIAASGAFLLYGNGRGQHASPYSIPIQGSTPFQVQASDAFDAPYTSDPSLVREFNDRTAPFPIQVNDRIAWIGSSSTYIGVWTQTLEFLLRTRHPELNLTFARHSTGSGTYALAAARLPDWLERSHPTLVFLNYGANDSTYGSVVLDDFHAAILRSTSLIRNSGARAIHLTPQSGDIRRSDPVSFFRRKHFADDLLVFCKANGLNAVDVFHPLDDLQTQGQASRADYSINSDVIHLTDSAYVAWGFFVYERLSPPSAESSLEIDATTKQIVTATRCRATLVNTDFALAFERLDDVLPILPPDPIPATNPSREIVETHLRETLGSADFNRDQTLPPRTLVPLKALSQYHLKVTGLALGMYALECNGKPAGSASAEDFATGVNLNSLYLDAKEPAPWADLALKLWNGAELATLKNRKLFFVLKRRAPVE